MHVAIDLTALLPLATGVDHYLTHLVAHLGVLDRERRYTVFVNYEDRRRLAGDLPPNFAVVPACLRPRPARLAFQQLGLPMAAAWLGVDIVHSPSFIMPMYRGARKHVLTVYDLSFFTHPDTHIPLRRGRLYRQALIASIRRADRITVPSHFTADQILELVPDARGDHIRVIAPGIDEDFRPQPTARVNAALARLRLPSDYLLYVGTIEPRKNLVRLVESYRRLVADHAIHEHLVLAGRLGWDYDDLVRQIASPELAGRVHLAGYVPQSDLACLYSGARLFVYPSLVEGFGFPPLEAMACGTPTVSSRSSSLLENLESAAELVEPTDTAALTLAMRRLLRDEAHRSALRTLGLERAARFRWQTTARGTMACYEEVCRPSD